MAGPDTVIIGAGIAGLTCAAAMLQAGIPCRLFEQASDLNVLGAGIQLSPNAVRLLHNLGMGLDLAREAVAVQALRFMRWSDDTPLATLPLGEHGQVAFGAPYYAMHRVDLHRVLRAQLPEGILHLGTACTSIKEGADRVRVAFDGGPDVEADVVVGADGIHSAVRTALAGDAPHYTGHVIYRGLVDAVQLPEHFREPLVRLWLGPGGHVVAYPVSAGRQLYFGAIAEMPTWAAPEWTTVADRAVVEEMYKGWSGTVRQLIEAADEITCWSLHDRPQLPSWPGRRVTLAGDAAHSMLPFMAQAANQAIEDAIVLAASLSADHSGAHATSLRRYEQLRQPRVDRVHQLSKANAGAFHLDDGLEQQARDLTFGALWTAENFHWLYGYDATRLASWRTMT
ncbi:FAD-dependent monooxygenase [Streptomyces sp. NPDC050523]|uniref:FAD-dependent monooxygenase n=1 Tax=Streptomyces sp. NPDC050523 TaxID=3365622 RepID=UPI0037AD2345